MGKFYSAKTGGFYSTDVHGRKMPPDVVEITDEDHRHLIAGQSKGKRIAANGSGHPVLADNPVPPISARRESAKNSIDAEAGNARSRFVSDGQFIGEEYREAEKAVIAWREAGSPDSEIPPELSSWVDAAGVTANEAATDIEMTASAWRSALSQIRGIRLRGKAAIDNAEDENRPDDMTEVARPFVDQLNAIAVPES